MPIVKVMPVQSTVLAALHHFAFVKHYSNQRAIVKQD